MDPSLRNQRATSFGAVADAYERTRPGYPSEARQWLVGESPAKILELGAGTGKLTSDLRDDGHDVVPVDPSADMLKTLRKRIKGHPAVRGVAEHIPLRTSSIDVVVSAQAYHWFDLDLALPEISRVLRPGGRLALVWNTRDESVPWVKKLTRIIGAEALEEDPVERLDEIGLYDGIETKTFRHWQQVDRDSLLGLVESRSHVASLGEQDRRELLEQVGAMYDDYGRGHDGMLLPYLTSCFRARVSSTGKLLREGTGESGLDDGLLIDFS
ncbi:MAG: methyltransferase domain-containing protein [Propionibacteriales bacterium]|nr:methyltransferase domain-containing protein [Propionibacteriales bacterium]